MAIPISWPTSEEVEDSYRSLDLILEQLLLTVRQVLLQRRRQQRELSNLRMARQRTIPTQIPATGPVEPQPEPTIETPVESHPRLPLPDLVLESTSADCEAQRPKVPSSPSPSPMAPATPQVSTWVQVGADLRHIADSFRAERASEQNNMDGKSSRLKGVSILSLFCPALGRSIWTTVALLLGWGLFTRTR